MDSVDTFSDDEMLKQIAMLFLKMYAVLHVSEDAVQQIINGLCNIHLLSRAVIKRKVQEVLGTATVTADATTVDAVADCMIRFHPLYNYIAPGKSGSLSSANLRRSFIRQSVPLVEPVELEFGHNRLGRRATFMYVPILKVIQQHLKRPDVANKVLKVKLPDPGNYSSYFDGSLYKSRKPEPESPYIYITLYSDDWESVNPLGTSKKVHKINSVYWTFTNLDQKYKSAVHVTSLACMAKSADISDPDFGWGVYLQQLLKDLKFLENCGIYVDALGSTLKGSIAVIVADNLGAHSLGGFVQSFGPNVQYMCHFCSASTNEINNIDACASSFPRRTLDSYKQCVRALKDQPSLLP